MYAKAAHPSRDRSFFYFGDLNRTLKPLYFIACLKEFAIHSSLDPRRVSFHSLRIGSASALAAAGVPDYISFWIWAAGSPLHS